MIENKKIKIGFLLNSSKIPKWQYLAIEKLNALPFTSLDLVLLNKSKKEKSKRRNLLLLKKAVYIIYEKLDNLIFDKNCSKLLNLSSIHTEKLNAEFCIK